MVTDGPHISARVDHIPPALWIIAVFALAPFPLSAAAYGWGAPDLARPALTVILTWSGVILAFLGGARWGLESARPNPRAERLVISVLSPVVGWTILASRHRIAAWKTYTQWGPDGQPGFYLDDPPGIAMIEKARKLGIRNVAVHKGLAFGPKSYEHSTCVDVGRVAKRYPDVNFLIYHSGYVAGQKEGLRYCGDQ